MKRMVIVLIAVLLATCLPGWAGKEAAARDKEFIRIAGGSTGATFHIMASGICTPSTRKLPRTTRPGRDLICPIRISLTPRLNRCRGALRPGAMSSLSPRGPWGRKHCAVYRTASEITTIRR